MNVIVSEVVWGSLIVLFGVAFVFASIIHTRMMRHLLERNSIFSPSLLFRAMETRDFYLFLLLVCILGLIGLAMGALKEFGL